jgi:hypothetical protein
MQQIKGYINFRSSELNLYVYRIMSLDRLYQMFYESSNYLVRPIMWEDPFENFIAKIQGRLPDGQIVEFAQRYDFYGQCWTLLGGTDAMWRIYSKDKRSVRIMVRLKDLYGYLSEYATGALFIGKVKYLGSDQFISWIRRVFHTSQQPNIELIAKTFLVKRGAFSHENEVRLLYYTTHYETGNFYRFKFDCHRFVKEIMLDPRLKKNEADALAAEVRTRTEYKGKIVQSKLYAQPDRFYIRLGPEYTSLTKTKERITYEGDQRILTRREDGIEQLILPVE